MFNLNNPSWRENTIFATARDKQLAWLKEHEKEIVAWVHSEYPKIETVQFDWNTLKVIPVSVGFTVRFVLTTVSVWRYLLERDFISAFIDYFCV